MKNLILFCLLINMSNLCHAQHYPLWDDLPNGKYHVGFKRLYSYDHARVYRLGKAEATHKATKVPRPIIVNIWYPSVKSNSRFMKYKDYFVFQLRKYPLTKFAKQITDYNYENFAGQYLYDSKIFDNKDYRLPNNEQSSLDKLLRTNTAACLNASPAPGKFPVVFYHQGLGGTVEDNSVLCEMLAAHGYVVVSSCFQSEEYPDMNVNWDLVRSANDIDFILNMLRNEKNTNFNKVAVMGHSYGAQAVAAYACGKNRPVDAIVSIDPTFDYDLNIANSPFNKLYPKLLERNKSMTVPVLALARSTNGEPLFLLWDSMRYAQRYYLSVPLLKHNDFTSQGALHSFFDIRNTEDSANNKQIWINYKNVCTAILGFINTQLGTPNNLQDFKFANDYKVQGFVFQVIPKGQNFNDQTVPYKIGMDNAPNNYQMMRMILDSGAKWCIRINKRFLKPSASTELMMNEVAYGLLYKFKRVQDAIDVFTWNTKKFPGSWNAWDSMAEGFMVQGDNEKAVEYYTRSLYYNPKNENATTKVNELKAKGF